MRGGFGWRPGDTGLSCGHHRSGDECDPECAALAGEVWQESDNVLMLCVVPCRVWQDFNGHQFPWNAPTIAHPLRRLLDRAGNLAPEYPRTEMRRHS